MGEVVDETHLDVISTVKYSYSSYCPLLISVKLLLAWVRGSVHSFICLSVHAYLHPSVCACVCPSVRAYLIACMCPFVLLSHSVTKDDVGTQIVVCLIGNMARNTLATISDLNKNLNLAMYCF